MQAAPIVKTANDNIYSGLVDALKIAVQDVEIIRQEFHKLSTAPIEHAEVVEQFQFVQTRICSIRERYLDKCGVFLDLASEISINELSKPN